MKRFMVKKGTKVLMILVLTLIYIVPIVKAGELTTKTDQMSRVAANSAANHTIGFTLSGTTDWDLGDTLVVTFPGGFNLTALANSDAADYDITAGGAEETMVVAGDCAANDAIEITSIVGQVITFTACPSYSAPGAGSTISIEIGTQATANGIGDSQIVNPGAGNDLKVDISGTIGDVGSLALSIIADDQVVITATVDPTLTFALGSNTCVLGTLSTTQINKCSYTSTVSTNGTNGYSSTIQAVSDGSNVNLNRDGDGTEVLADVADGEVTAGSEEYGVNTTQAGNAITVDNDATCTTGGVAEPTTALTANGQVYASSLVPVANEAITVCHAVAITGLTQAGNYTQTVTLLTTGNF